ncbi:MAG: phosphoserine transaminase [Methylocystis sp.]|uniref:phosphoserine transaminase n=1 Tax=Methylocystis sp. TaxID=1911079 RepID=UPI003DA1D095
MATPKPGRKPVNPRFSSGPCAKRPGWSPGALAGALVGRSHRSAAGRERLARAIRLTRDVLRVPAGHRIAIVPASGTGAVEIALWSLLGPRGVDIAVWDSFSADWASDVVAQLRLADVRTLTAPYGQLPDLGQIDFARDLVFAWNGTTSGVRVPDATFIPDDREGLTICDATSAAFAQALDFAKLDVTTFSWQKVLGGEAAHGVLILSPRAAERLDSHVPAWPMPKIFRLTKNGRINEAIFTGETINTPSMLAVEDYLDALGWARALGGLGALQARCDASAGVVADWVARTPWIDHLARDPATRSNTSVCLVFSDESAARADAGRAALAARMVALIEAEGAGFDFGAYRTAPPGFRIWCGATVEAADVALLTEWLDWAYREATALA